MLGELKSQKLMKAVQISSPSFNKLFSIQNSPVNILDSEFKLWNIIQVPSRLRKTTFVEIKSESNAIFFFLMLKMNIALIVQDTLSSRSEQWH